MYKLIYAGFEVPISSAKRLSDNACIPFDSANTDYQRFKQDLTEGAELRDADGNVMTAEQVEAFLATLPAEGALNG